MPDGLLAGRTALVTGAARGIGLGVARRFCEEGASVALSDVRVADVEAAVSALTEQGHRAVGVPFDVSDEEAVETGVLEARDRLGGLDVLVANAGVLDVVPALETSVETWQRLLDVNLTGVFLCLRAAGRLFVEQRRGVLLATASQAGRHGYPGEAAYCASKFGVVGLVEVMAKELAGSGIRVNAVAPGTIRTRMEDQIVEGVMARTGSDASSARDWLLGTIPFGRPGTPDEVGDAFVYLASDLSTYVSGTTLVIDGGECS